MGLTLLAKPPEAFRAKCEENHSRVGFGLVRGLLEGATMAHRSFTPYNLEPPFFCRLCKQRHGFGATN